MPFPFNLAFPRERGGAYHGSWPSNSSQNECYQHISLVSPAPAPLYIVIRYLKFTSEIWAGVASTRVVELLETTSFFQCSISTLTRTRTRWLHSARSIRRRRLHVYRFFFSSTHGGGEVLLVCRTSAETTPWTMPIGPEAIVRQLLDVQEVRWTSMDVVRSIQIGEGEAAGPVVLWIIGIAAKSLTSANRSLKEFNITDLEVEFRGLNLRKPASDLDPDVDVCGPLTPALALLHRCPGHTSR
jgi:hypothetical protein